MQQEPGDDYLRRLASFVRDNEKNLAEAGFYRRRRPQHRPPPEPSSSILNPFAWFTSDSGPSTKPVILSIDTHRIFYVLMRMEALGFDVGTLDVQVDNPSRPMSYINIPPSADKSETLSLASFRSSLSAVSGLSLGGSWWGQPAPPTVDSELRYLYSSFTKLPALSLTAPGHKIIAELINDSPHQNALPLDTFKNLQKLECVDIDPRTLLGWDRLAEGLVSLKIKKSGLEDVTDIFIGAVIDDQARREGSTSRKRRRRILPHGSAKDSSFFTTRLPDSVPEDADAEEDTSGAQESESHPPSGSSSPPLPTGLSSSKWAFLKHLSLSDNSLTFFPSDPIPYLTSLTHLDLSSNLLVSVPPGLGALYNLVSLNLADNMIDSVLGIYLNLGQVLTLNVAHNRLDSICGLERLSALERVDLRGNLIEESAEVGRLAVLPNIAEVWVEGNPLVELEEGYRVTCFDYFWKEHKMVKLDGTQPGFYERKNLTVAPPEQMTSSRPISIAYSPPVVAVGHQHPHYQKPPQPAAPVEKYPTPPSSNASPSLAPVGAVGVSSKPRRKKVMRIVELDGGNSDTSSVQGTNHSREFSAGSSQIQLKNKGKKTKKPKETSLLEPTPAKKWGQIGTLDVDLGTQPPHVAVRVDESTPIERAASSNTVTPVALSAEPEKPPPRRTRHSRYQTEFVPSSSTKHTDSADSFSAPFNALSLDMPSGSPNLMTPPSIQKGRGSATFSSRSGARRARVSASVYEPPSHPSDNAGRHQGLEDIRDNADAYRKKIEALKKDMGDGWLKVFSQSQMKTPNI